MSSGQPTDRDTPISFHDPARLADNLDALEDIEKTTMQEVCVAFNQHLDRCREAFENALDAYPHEVHPDPDTRKYSYLSAEVARALGEDLTNDIVGDYDVADGLDFLTGRLDHKCIRYAYHPDLGPVRQALFLDSKSEKDGRTSTLQRSQTSLDVMFKNTSTGEVYNEASYLSPVIERGGTSYLTTTLIVKYEYEGETIDEFTLNNIVVACIPNGLLQERYNASPEDGDIWRVGRNSPEHDEDFRVRIKFSELEQKAEWRVVKFPV